MTAHRAAIDTVRRIPREDAKVLTRFRRYRRITTDKACREARDAIAYLKGRIAGIRGSTRFQRLKRNLKQAYDEVAGVEREALARYTALEAEIRDEVSRYETVRERARLAAQAALEPLLPQLTADTADDDDPFGSAEAPAVWAGVVLQPIDQGASRRKAWHAVLVDPKAPRDAQGNPVENVEAGLAALIAAVAKGKAPRELLRLDEDAADQLAAELEDGLAVPGLVADFTIRPIIGARR